MIYTIYLEYMCAWKHSQYFLEQPDFLQLHPRTCEKSPLAYQPAHSNLVYLMWFCLLGGGGLLELGVERGLLPRELIFHRLRRSNHPNESN